MAGTEEQIEALDQLLKQVADDPVVQEVRERAEDSGHLDDDWIMALSTGSASDEEMRRARRHVVFCDQCADLLLNRGGEADVGTTLDELAPKESKTKLPTTPNAKVKFQLTRRESLMISIGVALVVVVAMVVHKILPAYLEATRDSGQQEKLPSIYVSARGSKLEDLGRLSLSQLCFLKLAPDVERGLEYVYVIVVDSQGQAHRIEPIDDEVRQYDLAEGAELPGEFGGYNLVDFDGLQAGQQVAFLVFSNAARMPILEGDVFARVTSKTLGDLATQDGPMVDEKTFRAFVKRVQKLQLPGTLKATTAKLIP